jgi:acyl-CoA synthetase (AMP-forming)/AMP-acid ligase II
MRNAQDTFSPAMSSLALEVGPLTSRQCATLPDVLRRRATQQPERLGYRFLLDRAETSLTYGELDRRARAIAATLSSLHAAGERVLLIFPPGLDFICAWFGCAYAGAAAVALPPPQTARTRRFMSTTTAIAADAQPVAGLTTAAILQDLPPELGNIRWVATDSPAELDTSSAWPDIAARGEDIAFLQYTSGSTTAPRGVVVTHANLMANLRAIERTFWSPSDESSVSWLPPYHDMGLIGAILGPLYVGAPVTLMAPVAFIQRPVRWLQAISRFRGAVSGGPSFAYDLCVRRITPEQRAGLDLSCWRVAFNGAEPINPATIRAFTEQFASSGFAPEAFKPCYGLAEATLLVSVNARLTPPRLDAFRRADLERNRAVRCADDAADARVLASSGQPHETTVIVDPDSRQPCPPGQIGEIWVSGSSVASGYWNHPTETTQTFGAQLTGSTDSFLRTGDLGFLLDGELFVTGRLKDLIIIDGNNHYPQDLERTVGASHPALDASDCAAFSVDVDRKEALVIVAAVPTASRAAPDDVQRAIRTAVTEHHDLHIHDLRLVKRGDIPKTASGKIRRRACRAEYLARQGETT